MLARLPLLVALLYGEVALSGPSPDRQDDIVTAAPATLLARQSDDADISSREGLWSWVDVTQGCPLFTDASFESSVSSCFTSFVGSNSGCEFEDKTEWLFPQYQRLANPTRFSSCVCPVSRGIADSCFLGCPRLFTDVSIKLEWQSICTEESWQTPAPEGSITGSAEFTGSHEGTASSTATSGSETASGEPGETGSESGDGDSGGSLTKAPPSIAAWLWLLLPLAAVSC